MKKKKIIYVVFSIALCVCLFFAIQRLVEPKYADDVLEGNFTAEYYEETTNHDVIMVGDCEVYENFNPMYLWKNYGITSYIRGNAQQLPWQSYYMLEDTIKYETPKVVIYNVQSLVHDTPQREEYNRMALDGMKWSFTKWDAIKASMCEGEEMLDYIFPILRYHDRISQLSQSDFKYYWNNRKITHNGYYMRVDVLPVSEANVANPTWLLGDTYGDVKQSMEIDDPWAAIDEDAKRDESDIVENTDLAKKSGSTGEFGAYPMKYLEKMRKLCEKNGIQFILVKAPSLAPQWYDSDNEQVVEYATQHNIPYINFYELLDEVGMDYETDTYDGGLHMNLNGANKLSKYLGKVLIDEYGIKDHKEDEKISKVYKKKYRFYEDMIKQQQKELDQYGEVKSY